MNLLEKLLSFFRFTPDPKFIAEQLRKPSGRFAKDISLSMNHFNEVLYEHTIKTMQLKEGEHLLEIGYGNGKFFKKLFNEAENLKISGIDFSDKMFKAAKVNNKDLISAEKLLLHLGNSSKLPFPDAVFDKVFCINVIYFWEKPEAHLSEIHRVLKPGGRFYTAVRAKESMLKFPFIAHGFTLYDDKEWEAVLSLNNFILQETDKSEDPEVEINGQMEQLTSVCFVAQKVGV
jgi:SAM-dependent methyltransferase